MLAVCNRRSRMNHFIKSVNKKIIKIFRKHLLELRKNKTNYDMIKYILIYFNNIDHKSKRD